MACDPQTMPQEAGCFGCIPPEYHAAVQTYLLARIRGGSMDVAEIMRDTACMNCIPPGVLPQVRSYLLCQLANTGGGVIPTPTECTHELVDDPVTGWAQRVINNGGAAVSEETRLAMCAFCNGLDDAGLTAKMISVNCIAPDNLIAAITPLIIGGGNDPWTNSGPFVAADLTIDGLKGNGSSKYLQTGIVPASVVPVTECGFSFYTVTPLNANVVEMGVLDGSGRVLIHVALNVANWDCWNSTVGGGRTTVAAPLWTGFISGNRISAVSSDIYHASSTVPFASAAHIVTTGGARPTVRDVYAFAYNNNGVVGFFSSRRDSFFAIHHGLTTTECEDLFDLVQLLRTRLGGGYL